MLTLSEVGGRQALSRRQALKAGLITAAAVAAISGGSGDALAQSQATQTADCAGGLAVDIHAHYFPQAYLDVIADEGKPFGASYRMTEQGFFLTTSAGTNGPLPVRLIELKQRIADMDREGVSIQAISLTSPMAYLGDAEFSSKLAKAWNDAASAAHQAYPDRLMAFLTLPMLYPDRALDELNRASRLPGMRGVYMGTNVEGHDLDDPQFEPVLARIEALDLPVFLHPVDRLGGERLRPFYLSNLLGNPFETTVAASHLIFGGVLDRHPRLQIGLAHAGGAFPILIGRLDHGWRVRHEVKHLPHAPSTYLQRFIYDTIAHSKPIMEFVIKEVGIDRVMLGSDYCFDMGDDRPVQFVEQLELSSAQRKMILGGNAARVLKL